jgi:hypothetical protein
MTAEQKIGNYTVIEDTFANEAIPPAPLESSLPYPLGPPKPERTMFGRVYYDEAKGDTLIVNWTVARREGVHSSDRMVTDTQPNLDSPDETDRKSRSNLPLPIWDYIELHLRAIEYLPEAEQQKLVGRKWAIKGVR